MISAPVRFFTSEETDVDRAEIGNILNFLSTREPTLKIELRRRRLDVCRSFPDEGSYEDLASGRVSDLEDVRSSWKGVWALNCRESWDY